MRALVHHTYGPPAEVLAVEEADRPAIGDDAVLVRVGAAGVNWADWALVMGQPYMLRLGFGLRRPRAGIRGTDVAGTVEAVGTGVEGFRPGDEVFGAVKAAFAEYVAAPATALVPVPAGTTLEQAATIPMAGTVALQAMRDVARVQPGMKVLVNGASGGIGSYAVQIAKSFGADVTGTASTANLDLVASLGANEVVDYTAGNVFDREERYDIILDMADRHTLGERRRALTRTGTLIPNSGRSNNRWIGSLGRIIGARLLSPFVSQRLRPFLSLQKPEDLAALKELIEVGSVTPVVGDAYPLAEGAAAIAHSGTHHSRGRIVIVL